MKMATLISSTILFKRSGLKLRGHTHTHERAAEKTMEVFRACVLQSHPLSNCPFI